MVSPTYHAGEAVDLSPYGVPDVALKVVYPMHLDRELQGADAALVTVSAQALSQDAVHPFELVFPLPDGAAAFVDRDGNHVPGRLTIVPGYPDALPYDLRIVHGNTQLAGGLVRPYHIDVLPLIGIKGRVTSVPELAFRVRLQSRLERTIRAFAIYFSRAAMPYFLLGLILLLGIWAPAGLLSLAACHPSR